MRKIFLIAGVLFIAKLTVAQVGIGTNQPDASSILELRSTTKGFLPPRVALTATNATSPLTSPAAGLLVYNTASAGVAPNNVTPGYYYWNGSAWVNLTGNGVPYSGATGAVNLGAYDLTVNGIRVGRGAGTSTWSTAIGTSALNSNTTGIHNTAVGFQALNFNTSGSYNTAIGLDALKENTTGHRNVAAGYAALEKNEIGNFNSVFGHLTMTSNLSGSYNSAYGADALNLNQTGNDNSAFGTYALRANVAGSNNTAIGHNALHRTTESNNTGVGKEALWTNITGTNLTAIGHNAEVTETNLTNSTVIGAGARVSTSNTIQLGNTSVTSVNTSGTLKAGAITYPNTDGTSGQLLITNGSGIASWASGSNAISTVGTITSGTWSATTIAVANGGTGATSLTGILKGNGTNAITAAIAGTDYQAPLTNPVTGTGTANYIPKLTGASSIGNSQVFDNGTSVGIGVNTPNASAKLEVSSTTQGFLPPRMTQSQRESISNPVQGLVVYCTNCGSNGELQVYNGSTWTNMTGGVRSLVLGETYGGGIVAYILQPGDPGYNANVQKGLIAAAVDQNSSGIFWNNGSYTTTSATGTAIGTGLSNTNTIIAVQGATSTNYAAGLARAYNGGGFNDWFLPSKDELNKLYINRSLIGNMGSYYYWSSSEFSDNGAWTQRFADGLQQTAWKNDPQPTTPKVRAIRYF